jgi:carbon-monoxide dehydrogenase medium subunit
MRAIQYAAPRSLADAAALLREYQGRARILAGGTDLIPQVSADQRDCDLFIDGKRIPELTDLRFDPLSGLTIGAAVPCARIYEEESIRKVYPGLVDAATIIGGIAIQSRASIGGNLCNSGPAADSTPILIALGASALISSANGGRDVPVEKFCIAPGKNVMEADEMLVSIHIPALAPRSGSRYLRFIPRNEMDIAVVGVGVSVTLGEDGKVEAARIGLGAVGPTPLFVPEAGAALLNKEPNEESFALAAEAAQSAAIPITDMRGTAAYRKHMVGVLVRRALRDAVDRANGGDKP